MNPHEQRIAALRGAVVVSLCISLAGFVLFFGAVKNEGFYTMFVGGLVTALTSGLVGGIYSWWLSSMQASDSVSEPAQQL